MPAFPSHHVPRRPDGLDLASWEDLPSWSMLAPLSPFITADGARPASRATRVRVCADDDALWIRFDNDDDDPRATLTERDASLWTEDAVEVFIAPGRETPTVYYEFEVNPLGALFDARVSNPRSSRQGMSVDTAWDCANIAWGANIDRGAGQWSAWLRIPWNGLADSPRPGIWRANFYRIDSPQSDDPEFSAWSPTLSVPPEFHRPTHFGALLLDDR